VLDGGRRRRRSTSPLAADAPLFFRKAIVATGARPRSSDIPELEQVGYLTSETIFDLGELSARLGVIGGGPPGIGRERIWPATRKSIDKYLSCT